MHLIPTEVSLPSGLTSTAVALTASWPSRNTVAETVNSSPTTDFAGRLPASTSGRTSWTGMRPMGCCGGAVVGACWPEGLAPVLLESGDAGVVAGGVAVTRPTLLGLPTNARLRS